MPTSSSHTSSKSHLTLVKGSLNHRAQERSAVFVIKDIINRSFRYLNMLAIPPLPEPVLWLLTVKICPYRGRKDGEYPAFTPPSNIWGILYHVSIDKCHIVRHTGKNDWTLTFPDSLATKQWAHDLALANLQSRAGDIKRQGQEEIITAEGNGSNIQCPVAVKAEVTSWLQVSGT